MTWADQTILSDIVPKVESIVENNHNASEINIPDTQVNKCYSCKQRGTIKEHIISKTDHFVFNHDIFRRPMIIITSVAHYNTIYDIPGDTLIQMFKDIQLFVNFWNLEDEYQIIINNGKIHKNKHFHIKLKINKDIANRLRRDHFERIRLEKNYTSNVNV